MKRLLRTLLAFLVAPFASTLAQSESVPVVRAHAYSIASHALGEVRTVDVSLPSNYERDLARRYPILLVLDGEGEQEMAAAIARFHADAGTLPPMLVVGIRTADRLRALTPAPTLGWQAPAGVTKPGGAEDFLAFLGDELLPWVARTFRTDSMRVLVGHSLGGLFTAYAMAQRPSLATGWVLMEPSFWWNEGRERAAMIATLRSGAARHARVMAVNTEKLGLDTTRWGGDGAMIRELSVVGETHASMALAGLMQALRVMFADHQPAAWQPGKRPIATLDRYDSLSFRLGFPVPIPEYAFSLAARMSIDARFYDDAQSILDRMDEALGDSLTSRRLREKLAFDRANERPGFIPLEFPAQRPTALAARPFIGRWRSTGADFHEVVVRASGDSIVLHDAQRLPDGTPWEGDRVVVQITPDGTIEWGQPVFNGLAALLILRGRIQPDGTMRVTREVRGWVPIGPGPLVDTVEVLQRDGS